MLAAFRNVSVLCEEVTAVDLSLPGHPEVFVAGDLAHVEDAAGVFAWIVWLVVHIYYLVGFKNRVFVVIQWAWAYLTFRRGARLIVGKEWRFGNGGDPAP